MTAVSVFLLATALVAGVGILLKLPALRKERTSFIVPHMVGALASQMGGSVLSLPPVYTGLDRVVGVPNLFYWGYHALWLCGLYHLLAIAFAMASVPVEKRSRYVAVTRTACIVGVLVLLAIVLASGAPETPVILTQVRPVVAAFLLAANTCLLLPFTYLLWASLHCAPHTRPAIAKGLAAVAAGAALADVDGLINMAVPVVHFLGVPGFIVLQQVSAALYPLPTGILVLGVVLPSLAVSHKYRCFLHWRALRPLWKRLNSAQPEIVLHCSGTTHWRVRALADFDYRLYRRVIEIHDGILPLRPYLSATDEEAARQQAAGAGITGLELDVCVTAALLQKALARQRAGPPRHDESFSLRHLTTPPGGEDDLQSEVSWLRLVTRAYARHPLVPVMALP
jgi:hypothetical protein